MDPPAPAEVQAAAQGLAYRDFLTVALVVPESAGFPDNWIYVHSPEVRLGRIQNFGSWSPYLVKEARTCLGLEYFVFEGDDLWAADDADLVELGKRELEKIGLVKASDVEAGYVVRLPKAYPVYDETYKANVDMIRRWRRSAPHLFVGGWMVLVAIYATWPLAAHAGSQVAGNLGDPLEIAWRFAWGAHSVVHQPLHLFDANMFSPERGTLALSENHLGVSLPLAPIFWVTHNAVLVLNLEILLVLAAAGFGVYLL